MLVGLLPERLLPRDVRKGVVDWKHGECHRKQREGYRSQHRRQNPELRAIGVLEQEGRGLASFEARNAPNPSAVPAGLNAPGPGTPALKRRAE